VSAWPDGPAHRLGAPRPAQFYTAAEVAPDGRHIAAARYDGKSTTIFVWTVPTGGFVPGGTDSAPAKTFAALGNSTSLAFSRDGERLVAAQSDGSVRIWNLHGDTEAVVLRGHADAANSAAFSPDGSEIVSGGSDGTVRVWRLDESPRSVAITGAVGHIVNVAFTPDGKSVVAVGTRGARTWPCTFCGPTPEVAAEADRMATRALTTDERALFLHRR
jgi:WD40 repeat protein